MGDLLDLTPDQLLTTTRAVRKRLDLDRPVEASVIRECLEIALQGPSGSNAQSWQWLVITDPDVRRDLAAIYQKAFAVYRGLPMAADKVYEGDDPTRRQVQQKVMDSADYLAEIMPRVPALVIPIAAGRMDGLPSMATASTWGSVLPSAWSFCLAARARGLGTAWTTLHLMFEEEAAELLGIPYAEWSQGALLPVAYTKGTDFKPAHRMPLDDVLHWDRW